MQPTSGSSNGPFVLWTWKSSHHTTRRVTSVRGRRIGPRQSPENGGLYARLSAGSAGPATPSSCRTWELSGESVRCVARFSCPPTRLRLTRVFDASATRRAPRVGGDRWAQPELPGARVQGERLIHLKPGRESLRVSLPERGRGRCRESRHRPPSAQYRDQHARDNADAGDANRNIASRPDTVSAPAGDRPPFSTSRRAEAAAQRRLYRNG
jgi:hypothetical protein